MNANEARKLAEAANTGNLDEIHKSIEEVANRGDYVTHFYFRITPEQVKNLEAEGYQVNDISERNETVYRVSWEEKTKAG